VARQKESQYFKERIKLLEGLLSHLGGTSSVGDCALWQNLRGIARLELFERGIGSLLGHV